MAENPNLSLPVRELVVNGRTFKVSYPIPSVLAFAEKTGDDLFSGKTPEQRQTEEAARTPKQKLERVLALYWAGLLHSHPEITYDQAAAMIHFGNAAHVEQVCSEAFAATMPEADESRPLATAGETPVPVASVQ